jgi:hypothetical protein
VTLTISCPNCALNFPLIAGLNEADAKRYAALMGELPPQLAKPLVQYLQFFKPQKSGLTWSRALKLIGELLPDIQRGQVCRNGRDWPAPAVAWVTAIQEMLERRERFKLPLRNHGYLYEVIAGQANRVEAQAEQAVEQRRHARPPTASQGLTRIGDRLSQLAGIERLLGAAQDETTRASLERQAARLRRETTGDQ